MKTQLFSWVLILSCPILSLAQNNHQQFESIDSVSHGSFNPNEAKHFNEWFQKGHTSGLFRANMMHTFWPETNSYHAALALGGRLYYHTAYWKGFQLGVGGLYSYNIASTALDSDQYYANNHPTWERQLFDLQDPSNKHDLDRLEELFVKYRHKDSYVKLGKMLVETPFVNPQDSRMKPSAFQGLWFDWNEGHKFEINGGVFNKVSPRSTTEWVHISESIGLYEHYQNDGAASPLDKNINLWLLGGHIVLNEKVNFHNWQYYINEFSYVNFNQVEWRLSPFKLGVQYVYQKGLDDQQLFIQETTQHQSHIISTQLKWINPKWQISYNTTQGLSDDPFVFPKEWGVEPFYTFISRHRIEAFHGVNSHVIKLDFQPFNKWEAFNVGLYAARTTYEDLDEVTKTKNAGYLNQLNLDVQARLKNNWENLSFRLLNAFLVSNEELNNPLLVEKILHTQLIVNYKF